jgi:peptidoglycan/xylan/chitin deacetylase (PgdA/CDA1 family)
MANQGKRLADFVKKTGAGVGLLLSRTLGSRSRGRFGILMYHRIAEVGAVVRRPTWNVTPRRFREQLEFILEAGYQVWPLERLLDYPASGQTLPERVTALTFDDGYENVFLNAWPVLRELGVPATIFVVTGALESERPFPFDHWASHAQTAVPPVAWRPLTWAQCRELQRSGLITIGSHTHTHRDFRGTDELFAADLDRSLELLTTELGARAYHFSFPYGSRALGFAGDSLMRIAEAAGVTCALTTDTDLVTPGSSPFGWGRFEVTGEDTGATIVAKLEGWYNWMGPIREFYRVANRPRTRAGG